MTPRWRPWLALMPDRPGSASARRLVLASGNRGKLAELQQLLTPLRVQVVAQSALGIQGADEPHATFLENALAKARHASRQANLPALADDSGLCCDALQGQPGVRSARLAGIDATDEANNAALLLRLAGIADRRAHFACVIVAVRDADDPEPLIAQGRWDGEVVDVPRGAGGFGYDPYFLVLRQGRTAAELDQPDKNRLSHRAKAMRRLIRQLRTGWGWA